MMTPLPHSPPEASADWEDVSREIDLWDREGRVATLWWRDDDATAPSDRLERLLAIAGSVPLSLAVIPALAEPELAASLADRSSRIEVLQHGWRHANHAADRHKSEWPAGRAPSAVAAELTAGRKRLAALFGARALPVLVPPWNRIDRDLLPLVERCGLFGLSRIGARPAGAPPATRLIEANVHVDLVAWRGDRNFVGEGPALGGLLAHLQARREGAADPAEPTGILTHHRVVDRAGERFLSRLFAATARHPAVRWLAGTEVFGLA